jgi:phosphatidylglycerol:prolipoprotein diacylglycerol transferase
MYFPSDVLGQLRHPSQLYELFLEGILLFIILWSIRKSPFIKERPSGILTALYLIGYGAARFISEFFRQPDNNWFFLSITIGQWFSVAIILLGFFLIIKNRAARPA